MSAAKRWFVLVGGINGAGKSTFAQARSIAQVLSTDVGDSLEIINPDLVTIQLRETMPNAPLDSINLLAAETCEARVRDLLHSGTMSLAIETVLSTDKYKPIVELALSKGYSVYFTYVLLGSVDEAIARVKHRVSRGGHDVAENRIRSRWPRSLANVSWFWEKATRSLILFNGDRVDEPVLVAARSEKGATFNPEALSLLLPAALKIRED